jgi:hypothetical protein
MKLNAAQTGSQAVLLVQRQLLLLGVDSARMTTDYGIDLVAYDSRRKNCFTIQVKCRDHHGIGKFSWRVGRPQKESPADIFALVEGEEAWYLSRSDIKKFSIPGKTRVQLYFHKKGHRDPRKSAATYKGFLGPKGIERFLTNSLS